MFETLKPSLSDPILGLMGAFRADPREEKIDLGVGVYKNGTGQTPVLACVKTAEAFRLQHEDSKSYVGMAGDGTFNQAITALAFGANHSALEQGRISTIQSPGGTGALRIAGEFIKRANPSATVWLSTPTWGNHIDLFGAAGLKIAEFPYYDYENKRLRFDDMMHTLAQVPAGDIVLLHACCHNPSGMDLNEAQWQQFTELATEKGFTPLIDMAYQGFGQGLDSDASGLRLLAEKVPEMIVCCSGSKNFGLYRERIGACSVVSRSEAQADVAANVLANIVRGIYSMPPHHGAAIIGTILGSSELTTQWQQELAEMRDRINGLRSAISSALNQATEQAGLGQRFDFIERQAGMFSFLGITPEDVEQLRLQYGIYMVGSSRMNVAGINQQNLPHFAQSVAKVLNKTG